MEITEVCCGDYVQLLSSTAFAYVSGDYDNKDIQAYLKALGENKFKSLRTSWGGTTWKAFEVNTIFQVKACKDVNGVRFVFLQTPNAILYDSKIVVCDEVAFEGLDLAPA